MKRYIGALLATCVAFVMVGCATNYEPVATFTEADDPIALSAAEIAAWDKVDVDLNAAWGSTDLFA